MLREPHGCFEQLSSTTHPGVFILRIMEASGNLRPATRKRAIGYPESGYGKLKAYEVAGGGFEWFGQGQANTLLTAYGLLEFTDMQHYIAVDSGLLRRTRELLLNRRNGKGGFLHGDWVDKHPTAHTYASNSYIVYAMTEAGLGDAIRPEYDTAVQRALAGRTRLKPA